MLKRINATDVEFPYTSLQSSSPHAGKYDKAQDTLKKISFVRTSIESQDTLKSNQKNVMQRNCYNKFAKIKKIDK